MIMGLSNPSIKRKKTAKFCLESTLYSSHRQICLLSGTLKTGQFGPKSTLLINRLLPLLRENFLTKFSYFTQAIDCFPTPAQLQYLWSCQKHLQGLQLYSHMVPWLARRTATSRVRRCVTLNATASLMYALLMNMLMNL